MALDLSTLSLEEIRRRYLLADEPVPARLLGKLERDPRLGVRRIYEALKKRHAREREERLRLDAMLNFERLLWRQGVRHVAGVDEVGVGPLAGPVVAAAVVFPPGTELPGVDDSKRLDPERREELAGAIHARATAVGIGLADVGEIDRLNIYHAALLAMRRAVEALSVTAEHLLVDARTIPAVSAPQNHFAKGDGINFSIAAASIVAKTHRDRLMDALDAEYPGYGLARHKGYGTPDHQEAIRRLGPSAIHRMSFPVIRELCGELSARFYECRRALDAADSRPALQAFQARLEEVGPELAEHEQRKLRTLLARRWKTAGY